MIKFGLRTYGGSGAVDWAERINYARETGKAG